MSAVSYKPHYHIEDYLLWEGDWELWDGIPVAMSPAPSFFHQTIGMKLGAVLVNQLSSSSCPDECLAVYESDWHVDATTVVRPDLMVVCEKPEGQWISKRPELAVEILSPSTRHKDLTAKRNLYALNRVRFYLIVDPEDRTLLLLKLDEEGVYHELPSESPFEIHPGWSLQLETAPLFV